MNELLLFAICIFLYLIVKKIIKSKMEELENESFKMEDLRIANSTTDYKKDIIYICGLIVAIYILFFLFR